MGLAVDFHRSGACWRTSVGVGLAVDLRRSGACWRTSVGVGLAGGPL